jgi:putative transposase
MLGFSLMPNHFVIESLCITVSSDLVQWLDQSRRYHTHYGSSGHISQGRFRSFSVQRAKTFVRVLRYVLQNPVRSGLAASVEDWPYRWCRSELADPRPVEVEETG